MGGACYKSKVHMGQSMMQGRPVKGRVGLGQSRDRFGAGPAAHGIGARLCAALASCGTLVIPRTPMLGLDEVDPLPVPSSPAIMQQMPSVKIPL